MDNPERIKRPVPERKAPIRNVLGALGQSDGMLNGHTGADTGGHPLGPGFAENPAGGPDPIPAAEADPLGIIDAGVRAASELVDAHIRQGEETAKSLGAAASGIPLAQTDVSGLLTGLVRAYSDVASVWVDIVGSLAHKIEGAGKDSEGAPQTAGIATVPANFGLRISSTGSVETAIEMFRPAERIVPQPLVSTTAAPPVQINDISFEQGTGGKAGKLAVKVPPETPAGTYHGLLLCAQDHSPAGVLTLIVGDAQDTGGLG